MNSELLYEKFRRMGARVKVTSSRLTERVKIDVGHDRKGEFFDLNVRPGGGVAVDALDVRPRERHLLLAVRDEDHLGLPVGAGQRFLCGHDERAWFVAAVPEGRGASNVRLAMEALKPAEVLRSQAQAGVRFDKRNRRRNAAFVRQGEWFFVPAPRWSVTPTDLILRDEPLSRGAGSKPHRVEELVRAGGEVVFVHRTRGDVLTTPQHQRAVRRDAVVASQYVPQRRNMSVLVRGRVRHPDHKTIVLRDWHAVAMNTEHQSVAMRFVAFID